MLRPRFAISLRSLLTAAAALMLAGAFSAPDSAQPRIPFGAPLRVMTFNIRVQTASDGANDWPSRKDLVAGVIRFHQADIAGLQECYFGMAQDLKKRLPGYEYYGVGSADGERAGAMNPVFWRRSRFELIDCRTRWLCPSPDKPGKGWDAAYPRAATLVTLRERETGGRVLVVNTHLDHEGSRARTEAARLVRAWARGSNVIVLGDFNCEMGEEPCAHLQGAGLRDAQQASETPHFGLSTTFNDFKSPWPAGLKIDHIFVSRDVRVLQHAIAGDTQDGRLPSDHFPVIAELQLQR